MTDDGNERLKNAQDLLAAVAEGSRPQPQLRLQEPDDDPEVIPLRVVAPRPKPKTRPKPPRRVKRVEAREEPPDFLVREELVSWLFDQGLPRDQRTELLEAFDVLYDKIDEHAQVERKWKKDRSKMNEKIERLTLHRDDLQSKLVFFGPGPAPEPRPRPGGTTLNRAERRFLMKLVRNHTGAHPEDPTLGLLMFEDDSEGRALQALAQKLLGRS